MSNKRVNPFRVKIHLLECENEQKDLKIAELEAKLAEMTEKYNACQEARKLEIEFNQQDKAELKQQLAEKEKEIGRLKLLVDSFDELKQYDKDADLILLNAKTCYMDGHELVVKTDNQDKISFCIEQLEKVKELAHNHIKEIANDLSEEDDERLNQKHTIHGLATAITDIDNQIKELKEE